MNSSNNPTIHAIERDSVFVECKKKNSAILVESIAVGVIVCVFAGFAWVALSNYPLLKAACVIVMIFAIFVFLLVNKRNSDWLVLQDKVIGARCSEISDTGDIGREENVKIPVEKIQNVWVGKARDYSSGLLMNHWDSRTFPESQVLIISLKEGNVRHLVRRFHLLASTQEFLRALEAFGIHIEFARR